MQEIALARTLWLGHHTRSKRQLSIEFGVDDLRFTASYWYADVDFYDLEQQYGLDFMARIYFHISAFTANTLVSLSPDLFDPGPYARFCTPRFWDLWKAVVRGVWAQWRYEHDRPDYLGPDLHPDMTQAQDAHLDPIDITPGHIEILSFCGGGKDSLVSLKLLERSGLAFDTLAYSSSIYGPAAHQHRLLDSLLDAVGVPSAARRRIWAYDDLTDSPVLGLSPELEIRSLTAAETPTSVFLALPLTLQHGYTYLALGHERSADTGNLVWSRTGEEVNHQWGKSHRAEVLLNNYIHDHLIANCRYFSILKPIYDVVIFNLLAQDPDLVPYTHSCNLRKPWCGRCPKCAYVWINYMAYLPVPLVEKMFRAHGNLLDLPENQLSFRQMLGLEAHTPFECIGQIDEVRLAFELCRRKGITGLAMETFEREIPQVNIQAILARYLEVNEVPGILPDHLHVPILRQMRAAADRARSNLSNERSTLPKSVRRRAIGIE